MDKLRISTVENVVLERWLAPETDSADARPRKQRLSGTLHLVQHHLFFSPSSGPSTSTSEEIWIPYPSINLLTRLPQSNDGLYPLKLRTRTFESYLLSFEKDREGGAEDVWLSIKDCSVVTSVEQLYAFYYRLPENSTSKAVSDEPTPFLTASGPLLQSPERISTSPLAPTSTNITGWDVFNSRAEFTRQGLGIRTKAWRFTDINKDYSFCPTYPAKLVVPSRISDNVLSYAGKYRSKARIPVLTYLHWANHASITRSSQPMVGLKQSRSAQDEKLVECIFSTHLSTESAYTQSSQSSNDPLSPMPSTQSVPHIYGATATNLIIDARPTANAMANVAVGAGSENMDNYKTGKKAYLGIDNIHVMRNSLKTVDEAVKEAEDTSGNVDRMLLRKSNWLKHISTLLDGALVIVRNVHLNASHVLIHCSDGWDRTGQLSATAQLCLDPYYRTIEGFKVLIEKDWLAFGHKFLDRSGHLSSEKLFTVAETPDDDSDDEVGGAQKAAQAFFASMQKQFSSSNSHLKEISPVFHQFLDCVWQLQRQFPERFEFNEQFLLDLHYHLYACQFGTFLFNNEQQRRTDRSPQGDSEGGTFVDRTVSAWNYFRQESRRTSYINESYDSSLDDLTAREQGADQGVLLPDPKDVKFWWRLFKRGDEEMNGSRIALQQAQGAQMLEVGAGQVDPVVPELVAAVEASRSLEVPYKARRTPSPTPTPPSLPAALSSDHIGQPPPLGVSGPSTSPYIRSNLNTPQKQAAARAGWNWSQLSNGAFNVIQKGARDIRTIGQEAMSQLRAEAGHTDGEMWARSDDNERESYAPGTGIGEGWVPSSSGDASTSHRDGPKPALSVRAPSQSNPWVSSGTKPWQATSGSANGDSEIAQRSVAAIQAPSGSTQKRQESTTKNPWKENQAVASLSDLSLTGSQKQRIKDDGGSTVQPEAAELRAAAPEDNLKAWDPLGAA